MLLRRIGLPFVGQQLKTTDQAAACDRRLDDLVYICLLYTSDAADEL